MQIRNSFGAALNMAPIERSSKTANSIDQTSTYSSASVANDLALYDSMPGSAYRYESYIVYKSRPFTSSNVNIDANGARSNGNSVAIPKKAPVIWLFGSSPVFGMTSADNETISSNVESALRQKFKRDVAVLNFGVPGYTSWQDLLNFQLRLMELPRPDLVIFFNGHNDHNLAWLSQNKACNTLLDTGVGSSRVLSESWEVQSHGGFVFWSALMAKLQSAFSNTFELVRLGEKFIALRHANANIEAWRQSYRERRDASVANAEACVTVEQVTYLRNMRMAAELAIGEKIKVAFVHQPVLYTTKKPLVGVELQEARHLRDAFFALNDEELAELESVPPHRINQDQMWVRDRYNATYEAQKLALGELAKHLNVRFIDLDGTVNNAGTSAIFSSSIHFTFRGTQLLGDEIAAHISDLLGP